MRPINHFILLHIFLCSFIIANGQPKKPATPANTKKGFFAAEKKKVLLNVKAKATPAETKQVVQVLSLMELQVDSLINLDSLYAYHAKITEQEIYETDTSALREDVNKALDSTSISSKKIEILKNISLELSEWIAATKSLVQLAVDRRELQMKLFNLYIQQMNIILESDEYKRYDKLNGLTKLEEDVKKSKSITKKQIRELVTRIDDLLNPQPYKDILTDYTPKIFFAAEKKKLLLAVKGKTIPAETSQVLDILALMELQVDSLTEAQSTDEYYSKVALYKHESTDTNDIRSSVRRALDSLTGSKKMERLNEISSILSDLTSLALEKTERLKRLTDNGRKLDNSSQRIYDITVQKLNTILNSDASAYTKKKYLYELKDEANKLTGIPENQKKELLDRINAAINRY